ncbi:MAG: sulfatase-like hydrolase/transferase, partial [Legionellales bacterium]|nr:sulfatase-like hydrolase/transferase [Legionellales bacterium]
EGNNPVIRDQNITKKMIDFIEKNSGQPFMGFVFFDSAHGFVFPKKMPPKFIPEGTIPRFKLNNSTDPSKLINTYKNALYYIDQLIAKILKSLEDNNLMENTIIIVTSDHGEEFNDNKKNYWGHNSNFSDFQTKVPLILSGPNVPISVNSWQTSHYDIAPTLLRRFFSCTNPVEDYSIGKDLFVEKEPDFLIMSGYTDLAVRTNKHICQINIAGYMNITDHNLSPVRKNEFPAVHIKSTIDILRRYFK